MKEHYELIYGSVHDNRPSIPFISFPTEKECREFKLKEYNHPLWCLFVYGMTYALYRIQKVVHD